ncbi:MAG: molybdopterin-binding protein [Novosphingobium sp.]
MTESATPKNHRIWTAALIVVGDEILSGRTHDKNIAQVATWLGVQGIRLAEVRVVPDVESAIVESVNALRARNDYLFTTGGIGPTHDDITVDAVAAAMGLDVVIHPRARAVLESYYATRGGLNEARLRMARVPEGASLIENRLSGAPGIRIDNVFLMAGVPHIAAQMLDALTGQLEGGLPLLSATIGCWTAESEVADLLREAEKAHEDCQIGSYPFFREGRVGANFVIRSVSESAIAACAEASESGLRAMGREPFAVGIGSRSLLCRFGFVQRQPAFAQAVRRIPAAIVAPARRAPHIAQL